MFDDVKALIIERFSVTESVISETATLDELGLNSLDAVELAKVVSDELGVHITDDEVFELDRLDRIVALLESRRIAVAGDQSQVE
ncbi:MAG TPA: acyl carrier protein [Pseudonocardiaceae bacterium]|jgi:acyl carrier protein|nr:acyl carrier protein [Pseudonocardiaceae bacterium]